MKHLSSNGFTIVESMIVLGISGLLLSSAIFFVGGRQETAQFELAMTDITSKMQSTMNEVASGHYPKTVDLTCTQQAGNVRVTSGGGVEQGSNDDCVFLGRAMVFGIDAGKENYLTHTLVGLKKDPSSVTGREAVTFAQAMVRPIAGVATGAGNDNGVDLSTTDKLQYGLRLKKMTMTGSVLGFPFEYPIAGIAFVINPAQSKYGSGEQLKSGTSAVTSEPISAGFGGDSGISKSAGAFMTACTLRANGLCALPAAFMGDDRTVVLCFQDGTNNRSGRVIIGQGTGNTTFSYTIHQNNDCI